MKFKITCDNCDYEFLTTGESRQTVQCQCPHCGGQMKVKLPVVPNAPQQQAPAAPHSPIAPPQPPKDEKPRRRTGCGIVVGIFLVLFLLVLAGMMAYSLTQHDNTKPIEDPFEHAYDDSISYEENFDQPLYDQPDTVEPTVEEHREVIDTLPQRHAAPEAEAAGLSDESDLSEKSDRSEKSDKSEKSEKSDHSAKPQITEITND